MHTSRVMTAPPRLREHLARLFPEHRVVGIHPLGPDGGATRDATVKAAGYGMPVRITLRDRLEAEREVVWRVASPNEFGHDRRSDRAAEALLAYDDFARIPAHVAALDVGAIRADGELVSIRDCGELYLVTTYARGTIYAEDLRHAAHYGSTPRDAARVEGLARYLAELHVPVEDCRRYRRAIRDLIGSGEGVFGIVDGYPDGVPGAPHERLAAIERRCVEWRWRLRARSHRLARTHGDFHPFNVVFDGERLSLLDASRGTCGDPADDLTAMAINFPLFAFGDAAGWRNIGPLWHRFWRAYLRERDDPELFLVAPPFLAWRTLVVRNPRFYPALGAHARRSLLGLAERALDAHELDPAWADELFA
jgi:hypothetical protein